VELKQRRGNLSAIPEFTDLDRFLLTTRAGLSATQPNFQCGKAIKGMAVRTSGAVGGSPVIVGNSALIDFAKLSSAQLLCLSPPWLALCQRYVLRLRSGSISGLRFCLPGASELRFVFPGRRLEERITGDAKSLAQRDDRIPAEASPALLQVADARLGLQPSGTRPVDHVPMRDLVTEHGGSVIAYYMFS
jgi:hypothetical protein